MIKNSIVNVLGATVPVAVALITVPLYLPLIGEERYGILAIIWVLLGYFGIFDLGLGRATARQMSKIQDDVQRSNLFRTVLVLIAILSLVGGGVLLLCSGWILDYFLTLSIERKSEAMRSIFWLPLGLMFLLLNSAMQGALQARERFVAINISSVLGDSMAQVFPLLVAWMGWGTIDYLLPAVLLARLLTSTMLYSQCRRYVPLLPNSRLEVSRIRPLLSYGGWASVLTMVGPLLNVVDRLVIASIIGAKGVAYFAIPYNLVTKFSILPNSIGSVLFPKMAGSATADARALARNAALAITTLFTPIIIVAILGLRSFMTVWLGEELADRCAGVAELMCFGVWMGAVVMPHSYFLYAEAAQKTRMLIVALAGIPVYILLLWYGANHFGVVGAAAAWSLKLLFDAIAHLYLAKAWGHAARTYFAGFVFIVFALIVSMNDEIGATWRFATAMILVVLSVSGSWRFWLMAARKVSAQSRFGLKL